MAPDLECIIKVWKKYIKTESLNKHEVNRSGYSLSKQEHED